MQAAKISPTIFFIGDMGSISSFAPIKNINKKAQIMYCRSSNTLNGVQNTMANINPAKIPIPPNDGIFRL